MTDWSCRTWFFIGVGLMEQKVVRVVSCVFPSFLIKGDLLNKLHNNCGHLSTRKTTDMVRKNFC